MPPAYTLILGIAANILASAVLSRFLFRAAILDSLRQQLGEASPFMARLLSCPSCLAFWLALTGGLIMAVVEYHLLAMVSTILLGWRGAYYLNRLLDRRDGLQPTRSGRRCHICEAPYVKETFIHRHGLDFCSHNCWFNHLKSILRERPVLFDSKGVLVRQEVYPMSFSELSPAQAQELLESNTGYIYLDVRSTPEYEQGHPAGAFNIPLLHRQATGMSPNPDFLRVVESSFPPDTKLLLGCQSGLRSARAAEALVAAGYTCVANVRGGFGGVRDQLGRVVERGWLELGLPVEQGSPAGQGYAALALKE